MKINSFSTSDARFWGSQNNWLKNEHITRRTKYICKDEMLNFLFLLNSRVVKCHQYKFNESHSSQCKVLHISMDLTFSATYTLPVDLNELSSVPSFRQSIRDVTFFADTSYRQFNSTRPTFATAFVGSSVKLNLRKRLSEKKIKRRILKMTK